MQEVRGYPEILLLTLRAWHSLERRIFQAAWLACGYFSQSHMSRYNDEGADISNLTLETAGKELSDMFDVCGRAPPLALQFPDPAPDPEAGHDKCSAPITAGFNPVVHDDDVTSDEEEFEAMMADIQDDDVDGAVESTKVTAEKTHVPGCFFDREVFCNLEKDGLTLLPSSEGMGLSYHKQSKQWHSWWLVEKKNFAPCWGQKRSELKALLLAMKQLWSWHLTIRPDDHVGQLQLQRIQEKLSTVTF
eukprot:Skav218690  [mRNA]  locus=scaffold1346:8132:10149:+ [translate_table: standard]